MNDIIVLLIGAAAGAYFAEPIRNAAPVLNPNKE